MRARVRCGAVRCGAWHCARAVARVCARVGGWGGRERGAGMGRPGWRPSAHGAAAIYGDNVRGDWKCDVPGRETDRGALAAIAEGGDALRATLASRQATAAVEAYWRDAEARGETGGLGATDDAAQREHDHKVSGRAPADA